MRTAWMAAVAACIVGLAEPVAAQSTGRDSLAGIGPVSVGIENIEPNAQRDGLTRELLQTAIELRFRQNSIPIGEEPFPYLYVRVNALKLESRPSYVYSVEVSLVQNVQTVRAGLFVNARTWHHAGIVGIISAADLRDVRDSVLDMVDEFSNDYLAVNPQ